MAEDVWRTTIGWMIRTIGWMIRIIRQALVPRPRQEDVVWVIRIFVALAVVASILILLVRFGLVSSDNAAIVGALIALTGVFITQIVNARIARSNQLQQQELETGRARAARFQAYLEQMGTLLVDHHLAASNPNSRANALSTVDWAKNLIGQRLLNLNAYDDVNNARVVAQAQTLAVLERVW